MKKINITFFLITLLNITVLSQGLTIGSGTTITGGSANIILPGNWNNSGTFIPATSSIIFNGASGNQTIANSNGETFNNLITNKAANNVLLSNNITVNGTLTLSSGNLDLNSKSLSLGSNANVSESTGNIVLGGTLSTTQTINAPASKNIAGLGAELTSNSNFGSTIITRGSSIQTGNGNSGIKRYYDITPTNNAGLNATLVFHYDPVELNGLTESTLILFKSTDNGTTWIKSGGTVNTTTHTVTLSGIDSFSRWTLGSTSSPLTTPPTTQASNITASSIQTTQATISWTNGNGSARAVFIKQVNTGTVSPTDNTTYTANTVFGSGTQIGSSGWYCVYTGTGTSVTVTNLTTGSEYRVMVTEYNGSAGSEVYNTSSGTNNPMNTATTMTAPGNAINFDGTNDYVSTNNSLGNFGTGDFTLEAYIKTGTTGSFQTIIAKRASAGHGNFFRLYKFTDGSIRFEIDDNNNPYLVIASTVVVTDNHWHHVAVTRSGATAKIYIDGVLNNSGTASSTINLNNSTPLTLGARSDGSSYIEYFNGIMDEVRIWNVARTQAQLQTAMTNIIDPTTSGLVAYYRFDLGTAGGTNTGITTLYDQTSNGNNGTLTNFALTGSTSNWVESYAMVVPTATAATSLGTTSFTANWTAATVGIVDKYLLDVSTNSNFSSFVTGYNNLDAGSVLTKNITGLTGNTTYYYRVRADKSSVTGQGGNSNTTSTTTAPAAPTLSSPTNNATGSSLSPTLSWSAVSGADKYRLEVNQASDFSGTVIYDQDTVSLNSKQIGSLSDSTKYYWRVSAKNSSGNWGDVSSIFNFTTEQSSLTSPSNGAFSVSLTPTLSWPATTGANKYRLEVNTTSDFTGTVKLDTTTASTSKTMDGVSLIYNTTYYWRVTASSNSLSKTNSSSTYSFTTKLAATTLTSPSDNVTGVSLSPTLNWSSVTGANKYRLEVNTASDFSGTVIYNQDTVSLASKQIGGLSDNTTYYWRVTAKNSGGNSGDVSSIFNFTTTQQSAGTSPVNGSTNNSINPEFIWPVGPTGTNKYRLEVNTNNTFTGTTILDTTTTATSKILGGTSLEYNTLYYWRVTASSNALSKTNTSAVYSFTTQLAASTLISPANNATDVSLSPILIWSATGGTTGYRLEVNTASNFSGTVIYDQDTISQTSKQIGGLIDNTKYYWRVTALTNGGNTSDESSVFNFTTGQASLTSPSDDALSISLTPTFSWPAATGASSYHLEVNTSSDFTGTVKLDTTTSATSKVLNGLSLSNNTTYYWRVTATSSGLWKTNTSSVYSFTTKLATTALSSPTNNATGVSLSPTLSWSSVTGADKYRLEVNTASGFDGEVIYDQDTVGLNTKQIAGLTDSTKYYWRVTALTSSGNYSDYSTVRYFTTVSSVTQSTLIVPESGSTDVPTDPTLSWPVTDGANSFRLEVNTDVNFGSGTIFLDTTGVTSDSLSLAGLEPNTTYYWRVTASSNSLEKTNSSQVFSFTTGAGPLPVELTKFSAKSEDSFVILIWQTATEVNNYGFEVQRSSFSDQPLAWTKIGFVPGAGNSNSPKDYSFKDQPIGGIKFSYRLKQLDVDGNFKYYDAIKVSLNALAKAELMQNSPNPFNPSTSIKFYIPDISSVTIKIYDILGKEVNTLFNEKADAGYHIVYWNGKDKYGQNAASGVYFYRLSTNVGFVQTKKMLLLK